MIPQQEGKGMEAINCFLGRHKRKCPDDLVVDLLNNVSLSPNKRSRQDNSLPTIYEDCHELVTPVNCQAEGNGTPEPSTDLWQDVQGPLVAHEADDRALVLYKPIAPPLFPGGPLAGSPDLPIKVSSRLFSSSNGMLDTSNLLTASMNHGQFRWFPLDSSSSMSSDPQSSDDKRESDTVLENSLAMIPWKPCQPNAGLYRPSVTEMGSPHGVSDCTDNHDMQIEGGMESEAMEEDNPLEIDHTTQFNNPVLNLGSEPWQHHHVPKPPCSSVMWSH